jgi:hypothetical protein
MEKEIKKEDAYVIACDWYDETVDTDFKVIETVCESSDDEDGGGHYRLILKEKSTGKFYEYYYCDWDISNTSYDEETNTCPGRCDMQTIITEVFPKEVTTTIYE